MTSVLKSSVDLDTTAITTGEQIDASDVVSPINTAEAALRNGRLAVSANDTHIKNLDEALTVAGSIEKSIQNGSADESLQLALVAKLEALIALLPATGLIQAAAVDSQSATSGHALIANGSGGASWADPATGAGGGGAEPVDIPVTAGEALSERDYVFLDTSDDKWYRVDTDATPIKISGERGVVVQSGGIAQDATGDVRQIGEVGGFSGLTAWRPVYAGATAGSYTQTKPDPASGAGQIALVVIGLAVSTSAVMVQPKNVQYMIRNNALANNGTLTIQHHADAQAHMRIARAYVSTNGAGATLLEYASSNQDADLAIQGPTNVTYSSNLASGGTPIGNMTTVGGIASVFDGDISTYGRRGSGDAEIGYDFGSGNSYSIRQYRITVPSTGSDVQRAPRDWTFQHSDDNSVWTTVDTITNETDWAEGETRTYAISDNGSHRYWRLVITERNGLSSTDVAELELRSGTENVAKTRLAQKFEMPSTSDVAIIRLWLRKVGSPTGNLSLRVETNSSNAPTGTLITNGASGTVAASTLSTSYGYIDFAFPGTPELTGNTTYWVILDTADSQSDTDYVQWGIDQSSPGLAGALVKTTTDTTSPYTWSEPSPSADAVFQIVAPGGTFAEPLGIRPWSFGAGECAVQYADGSGSNDDTQTTFKNVSGSALDMTAVLEVP